MMQVAPTVAGVKFAGLLVNKNATFKFESFLHTLCVSCLHASFSCTHDSKIDASKTRF